MYHSPPHPNPYPPPGGPWAPPYALPPPDYEDAGPPRAWYWAASLVPPGYVFLVPVAITFGAPAMETSIAASMFFPLLCLLSAGILIAVFSVRTSRRSRQRILHSQHLWQTAVLRGYSGPAMPPTAPPRPPAKEIRPSRLWYVPATACLLLALPASGLAETHATGLVGFLIFAFLLLVSAFLFAATTIERGGHRGRLAREHMADELERVKTPRGP